MVEEKEKGCCDQATFGKAAVKNDANQSQVNLGLGVFYLIPSTDGRELKKGTERKPGQIFHPCKAVWLLNLLRTFLQHVEKRNTLFSQSGVLPVSA